jgi:tetratricopeptide (TPR) repeat protein
VSFLGRLFGVYSPQERVERARAFLAKGEANEARLEVLDVQGPEAEAVLAQALAEMVRLNVVEARARFSAGDEEGGQEHLEMARQFGATADQLKDVRREARELREEARQAALAKAQEAEVVVPEGDDPLWSLPPGDPRVRFAMLIEAYPAPLRERLGALGRDFAAAVLLLEDGQAGPAWDALSAFVEAEPAARFERARAALALGQLARAASDLATFGEQFGHQRIGAMHTGVTLAQLQAQLGRPQEALALCDQVLARGSDLSVAATRAHLLHATGQLEAAERATSEVLRAAPKDLGLYRLLGQVRLARGNRLGAMQALEAGLNTNNCSNPTKCGFTPPDVPSLRLLARLYLEDRLDPQRAREVVAMLQGMVQQPTWEDGYVAALAARNDGDLSVADMVAALRSALRPGDPRLALVDAQFAPALTG